MKHVQSIIVVVILLCVAYLYWQHLQWIGTNVKANVPIAYEENWEQLVREGQKTNKPPMVPLPDGGVLIADH